MKLPLSWLNEYIQIDDIAPAELAEKLTRAGLQVEGIETVGGVPLSDLFVVVDVVECVPHPDSDHLHVCKVTDGKETFQVVCGAPNMRQGIKTAFAKIGAIIPGGEFKIKKGKLRGVESFGMCCSEKELHVGAGNDGIIEFPATVAAGTLVRDALPGEKPETVFEIEVTWNRPDALSVVGIAREYAAILHRPLKMPALDFVEGDTPVESEIKVRVEAPEKCPRYTARVVTSVEDGPSPEVMAKRLGLCGVRSLGLVVDVTNYVMLELGQPMHAFDYTKLADRTIVVRTASAGETMKTLDGVTRKLDPSMLMICDAAHPNAVAGIMGGEESEIAAGTKSVLLESALFDPKSTKDTATKLGLASESSYRYIRGVDKDLADTASRRAAHLLQKYGKAVIARGIVDVDNRKKPFNHDVTINFERARKLIGINIGNDAMVFILMSLGLEPAKRKDHFASEQEVAFHIPSWRWDLTLEADLVEEIARVYGLDNIPDTMPSAPSVSTLPNAPFKAHCRVRELCLALGFNEAQHYSFLSRKELDAFDTRKAAQRLEIPDPVSVEYGVMRDSLLPQLYQSLGRNAAHQLETVTLFEMGKVFCRAPRADGSGSAPTEREMLSLGFVGPVGREVLRRRAPVSAEETVLWLKGVVEELIAKLHAGRVEFTPCEHPAFAAAMTVRLNGRDIGVLGAVSQKLRHPFRLTTQMGLCEMELKMLLKRTNEVGKVSAVPQFPSVSRDIAVVAAPAVTNEAIVKVIRQNGGKELVRVTLFDIFTSKELKDGKRSLAYALEFRSPEKTLTDDEVGKVFQRIVEALKATAGLEVRAS